MKRVFLDRWVWIQLCRADLGRSAPEGAPNALAVARYSSANSLASSLLCPATYIEQLRNSNARQRHEIGTFMREVSRGHTLAAPVEALVQHEVDVALRNRFGRPQTPTDFRPFGHGTAHAFDVDVLESVKLPPLLASDPQVVSAILDEIAEDFEKYAICGPPGRP